MRAIGVIRLSIPSLLLSLFLLPAAVRAQTYTEENFATFLVPFKGWNMSGTGRFWVHFLPASALPAGFTRKKLVDISLVIHSDPDANGVVGKVNALNKLYGPLVDGGGVNPAKVGGGGNFWMDCDNLPQCNIHMERGGANYSYFQNDLYDDTQANRGYFKIEYLK